MPHIYVDPVVMAYLHERTTLGDTPNSTIRKHLGLPPAPELAETAATPPEWPPPLIMRARPGALLPLLASGRLTAGETLVWHRPRRGQTHIATVDDAGRLVTAAGAVFYTPGQLRLSTRGTPVQGVALLANRNRRDPAATTRAGSRAPAGPCTGRVAHGPDRPVSHLNMSQRCSAALR